MTSLQPTVRLKLTLVYGAMFLAAGAILLAVNYALVSRSLWQPPKLIRVQTAPVEVAPGVYVQNQALVQPVTSDGRPLYEVLGRVREQSLNALLVHSATALAIVAVASVGLGWVVAARVLQPVKRMTATARSLSEESLHERINLEGPDDEIKELADTFDAMLARLDAAFQSQRRFVANASHELRTPLSVMRTEIDVTLADPDASPAALRRMAETVREATERSERLIESLLMLARSERGIEAREPVDLAAAASLALEQSRAEARRAGLTVEESLSPAPVAGDRALLERLVANLVENAVRHNVPGGQLEVSTGIAGGRATVRVCNTGRVILPEEVAGLFEPFRRLSPERTGSARGAGLGLSIVRAVAGAHGGEARAEAAPEGGLEITVDFPAAGPPAAG